MRRFLVPLAFFCGLVVTAVAAPPNLLKHQGRVAVNGVNHDGLGYFKFAMVDGTAAQNFWANDGTASGEPAAALAISVSKGHYVVLLGDTSIANMTVPVTPSIFAANQDVRLRVWFAIAPAGPFHLLTPDQRITTAAYAFSAAGATLAPSYETGTGGTFGLESVSGSSLSVSASFSEAFHELPTVEMPIGWSVGATTESSFVATGAFQPQRLDGPDRTGTHTSLAVINGKPAISYRDDSKGDLLFVRALDAAGAAWLPSSIVRVEGNLSGDVGLFTSLAEVAGRPAIAYYDSSLGDLKYVRAQDASGTAWQDPVTVDGESANVGRDASLAVINGKPAIAYQSPNTGQILYAWAADAEGTVWSTVAVEGSLAAYRTQPSLVELGGKPALAFLNQTDGGLRYACLSGSDPAVSSDWSIVSVDSIGGRNPSLALIDGQPAIAHDDGSALRYVRATDADGATWGTPVSVGAGTEPSLTELGGEPAISYYQTSTADLRLAFAADAQGTSWPTANHLTVDAGLAKVGTHSSLAEVAGLPAMAYYDASGFDLKYAALPTPAWTATVGGPEPILASGVKNQGVTEAMLTPEIGVWKQVGDHVVRESGRVGVGRVPTANALEVEGTASKTTAGLWAANSDRRIKKDVRELEGAMAKILALKLVDFEYTEKYREAHPTVGDRRYPNVIAQEFAEIFPEWVTTSGEQVPGESDQILQVDPYPILIYSAAAIQEMASTLRSVDAENTLLKERLKALEAKVESLR